MTCPVSLSGDHSLLLLTLLAIINPLGVRLRQCPEIAAKAPLNFGSHDFIVAFRVRTHRLIHDARADYAKMNPVTITKKLLALRKTGKQKTVNLVGKVAALDIPLGLDSRSNIVLPGEPSLLFDDICRRRATKRSQCQCAKQKLKTNTHGAFEWSNDQYRLSEVVHSWGGGPQAFPRRPNGEQLRRRARGPGFRMAIACHLFYPSTRFPAPAGQVC